MTRSDQPLAALTPSPVPWWIRDDLRYVDGALVLGDAPLEAIARAHPDQAVYVVSAGRVLDRLDTLLSALRGAGLPGRAFFAVKSNRHPSLLAHLSAHGVGADVCSPRELVRARECGFAARDVSYTGTSQSESDLAVLARHTGVRVNLDSITAIRHFGRLAPGRDVGLRVNPARGVGALPYAGARPTKFGFLAEDFDAALAAAREAGLRVRGLHWHLGWGLLGDALPALDEALSACGTFLDRAGPLDWIDVGGGLGVPRSATDVPVDLAAWASLLARHLSGRAHEIAIEPGTFAAYDAGVLLMPVTHVEERGGARFVGVSAGVNLNPSPALYGLRLPIVPVRESSAPTVPSVVAGNINESVDVFDDAAPLPADLAPGETLALLCTGAYGSSMSSDHCLRGHFAEYVLPPR